MHDDIETALLEGEITMHIQTHIFDFSVTAITHPFPIGSEVFASRIDICRKPEFFPIRIVKPYEWQADLYLGETANGSLMPVLAHPALQSGDAKSALFIQWRASIAAEKYFSRR